MLQRLYVHNFKCLENFELNLKDTSSALLIGKNGVGKSSVARVLEILQQIARGKNRMQDLADDDVIGPKDFTRGRIDVPMRFEIEALLDGKFYRYVLALDLPARFTQLRVAEEQLSVGEKPIYSRKVAQVSLGNRDANFSLDWHLVALPIIQEQSTTDPIHVFKTWLARMIILAPIPTLMTGISKGETLEPRLDGSNFAEWSAGLLSQYPAAYSQIYDYLKEVIPDLSDFINTQTGPDYKSMSVRFVKDKSRLSIEFNDLSDGEKVSFLCATVDAANKFYGPLFCFWDEPDNFITLSEIGHFAFALRRTFQSGGQIIVTSHNPEAIRTFSDENTFVLDRKSHLEPTLVRLLREVAPAGDLINALLRGDVQL